MNTPHESLENELRALRPAAPGGKVAASIASALDAPAPGTQPARFAQRSRWVPLSLWVSWSAAATMAVALIWTHRSPARVPISDTSTKPAAVAAPASEAAAPASRFTPVSSSTTLLGTHDEGVVYLDDGVPARKLRLEYMDTINLRSTDDSRALVRVSYPSEEIRLVPVQAF